MKLKLKFYKLIKSPFKISFQNREAFKYSTGYKFTNMQKQSWHDFHQPRFKFMTLRSWTIWPLDWTVIKPESGTFSKSLSFDETTLIYIVGWTLTNIMSVMGNCKFVQSIVTRKIQWKPAATTRTTTSKFLSNNFWKKISTSE